MKGKRKDKKKKKKKPKSIAFNRSLSDFELDIMACKSSSRAYVCTVAVVGVLQS